SNFGYKAEKGELLTASTNLKKEVNILFGNQSAYDFEDTKRSWRNNRVSAIPDENGNMPDPFVDPLNDKMTLQLESQEFDENGNPKYPAITRDVNVTGILVADSSVGYETSYYCFMDIKDLRELYKEY